LREAAEHVYRNNRPVLYAFYLDATSRQEPEHKDKRRREALEVIEQAVAGKLSDEERARINNLWGVILTDQRKFEKAIEKFDLALEKRWYEWLLGSDRGWYAELMMTRALSDWNRHSEAVMKIEGFIADHPDKDEMGREALRKTYHNWGVWYIKHCPGPSTECEPAAKYRQDLSRAHLRIGDVAYLKENDLETALRHARRAEHLAVDDAARKGACELLIDVMEDLPGVGDEPTDADHARKRCEQTLGELDSL
jgi:tetratricopeptide (TPR) repeat protein